MGISTPTTQYVVEMARLFHITTDELITNVATESIQVNNLTPEQKKIIYDLINYFDSINK